MSIARSLILIAATLFIMACSSGSGSRSSDGAFNIEGSVGDGPIVGAEIEVYDADGNLIASGISDDQANYVLQVPAGTSLPVTVRATGGTDLVTQRAADFELVSKVFAGGRQTVNISPLTTLASKALECAGDETEARLDDMWNTISSDFNIGLDVNVFGDPLAEDIDRVNVATAVLANEAVGEWVRRTSAEFPEISADQVVDLFACDLADGAFDGQSVGDASSNDARVLAVAKAAEVAVRLEVLAGQLDVDGQNANAAMDAAIATILPRASGVSVTSVPVTQQGIDGAIEALGVLQGVFADSELFDLIVVLGDSTPANARGNMQQALNAQVQNTLVGLSERAALADSTVVADIQKRVGLQQNATPPLISLTADPVVVDANSSTELSWASSNGDQCRVVEDGALSDEVDLAGRYTTSAISVPTEVELVCAGVGGVATSRLMVLVNGQPAPEPEPQPEPQPQPAPAPQPQPVPAPQPQPQPAPAPAPTLALNASADVVDSGGNVTLSWTSQNTTGCNASGGWSGGKSASGQQTISSLQSNQTFTLNCEGAGGSAVAMVSVSVMGSVEISWQAPSENVDGTAVQGLSAFRIHYGSNSGVYDKVVEVPGTATSHSLDLLVGEYFIAMSAVDLDGDESALSNEVLKRAL